MFWYRGLARISSLVCGSGACRRIRSSQDCLVSSMAAHSSPRGLSPAARNASSGTRRSVLPIPSRPNALARRLAGSTVRTSTLPPWCTAAMTPAAAAVVVLPTPPGPQAMTISLAASSPSIDPDVSARPDRASSRPASDPADGFPAGGDVVAVAFADVPALVGAALVGAAFFAVALFAVVCFVAVFLVVVAFVAAFLGAAFLGAAAEGSAAEGSGSVVGGGSSSLSPVGTSSTIRTPAPRPARQPPVWSSAGHGTG